MKLLPPWHLHERRDWARQHPWCAGICWGLVTGALFTVLALASGVPGSVAPLIIGFWLVGGVGFGAFMRWSVRRGWGERREAGPLPEPSASRPWVRSSDRALATTFWIAAVGGFSLLLFLAIDVVSGELTVVGIVFRVLLILSSTLIVKTAGHERNERRRERSLRT